MTTLNIYLFEILKKEVLKTAGITSLTPADCKIIENKIFSKTGLRISETTLKRVYGFAVLMFNPSKFTLNALAKYCNYSSIEEYFNTHRQQNEKQPTTGLSWSTLNHNANKITLSTLQILKTKSGTPYPLTIKRNFLDTYFNEFLCGEYTQMLLAAPAGYGKTVAICHWIDEKLSKNDNDTILFLSSSALVNVYLSGCNINHWLLGLLGCSQEEDINCLLAAHERNSAKFYLIIDGIDEHIFKNEQFQSVLNQLMAICSLYKCHHWFKMVLTMRSSTWINNKHIINADESSWYLGHLHDNYNTTNVPLFNIDEIKQLCVNINPHFNDQITNRIAKSFNLPIYFQFYYKQYKNNFSLANVDDACVYELIANFIFNKVYLGTYSADKILLINALVKKMDFGTSSFTINKDDIHQILREYGNAYNELINLGVLRETNVSAGLDSHICIEFCNSHFLEFSITQTLLLENNRQFDNKFIDTINRCFKHNERKLPIIKWGIIYAIKNGQQQSFELLSQTQLTTTGKHELIIFLGSLLKRAYVSLDQTESLAQYFRQDCSPQLFDYFFGLEFINADYSQALETLLMFRLSEKKKIVVYSGLAATAVLALNMNDLKKYIDILSSFSAQNYQDLPFNPLNCLKTIYNYFKYGAIITSALKEVTRFIFNPPAGGMHLAHKSTNDFIYLLALYTLKINKNPKKVLRFIATVNKVYKPVTNDATCYNFFIKRLIIEENIALENYEYALKLHTETQSIYMVDKSAVTPFMQGSLNCLTLMADLYKDKNITAENYNYDACGYKLIKMYHLAFMQKHEAALRKTGHDFKKIKNDYNTLIQESELMNTLFANKQLIHN